MFPGMDLFLESDTGSRGLISRLEFVRCTLLNLSGVHRTTHLLPISL